MAAATMPIFDGHNDTLLRLYNDSQGQAQSFLERSQVGHLDLPRAQAGGFGGGLFAAFVPSDVAVDAGIRFTEDGYEIPLPEAPKLVHAQQVTLALVAQLYRIERMSHGQVKVCRTAEEIRRCLETGVLAAVAHLEGAEAIDLEFDALEVFYQAGVRSLGLVWSRANAFGTGVPFKFPSSPDTGPGLTNAGKALVGACNELGMLIDLSHLNAKGFWDVVRLSDAPLVATHSNAHALCPASRNLTDDQLAAIRDTQGVVGMNFSVSELRPDGHNNSDTPLEVMVRHIDYFVEHLGVNGVAFGSDFDGATMPSAVGDAARLPNLLTALRQHGYDDDTLRKLCFENWLSVLERTWHKN